MISFRLFANFVWPLAALIAMISLANAEPDFPSRYSPSSLIRRNISNSYINTDADPLESALEYLGKFGWVEPADWTASSPRFNETIGEGETVDAQNEDVENNVITNPINNFSRGLSEEEFADALRSFQFANGLEPTGELDQETLSRMTKIRCGVPDQTKQLNITSSTSDSEDHLNSTALPTFASNSTSAEDTEEESSGDDVSSNSDSSQSRKRRNIESLDQISASMMHTPDNINNDQGREINEFYELIHRAIPEGELPDQSRVEDIEEVLLALRKEKMLKESVNTLDEPPVTTQTPEPATSQASLLTKIMHSAEEGQRQTRQKRSTIASEIARNGWGMAFAKKRITWRLVPEWSTRSNSLMSNNEIWFTVKLAFRMWSEVLPRVFEEDRTSPSNDVDILIGFGQGTHNRCPVKFNVGSLMSEYAHAWSLPKAEIHFNGVQPFVPVSWVPSVAATATTDTQIPTTPISLLKVATHEIGHALGLPHSDNRMSIMNPYYQPYQRSEIVELSNHDRESIKNIYGTCDIPFNVVFDWVRQTRLSNGQLGWKYNSYFFRQSWYWLYENRVQRPRYGDPKSTAQYWRGVLQPTVDRHQKLDGAVHIRSWRSPNGPTFFFKGDVYVEYDNKNDRAKTHDRFKRPYPRRIADDFPGVPYPIDTVFFNIGEELLYFFKNNKVYRYSWKRGALVDSASISTAFPGWGGATSLPDNLDAAYYSYAYQAYYFFKGTYYWKLADAREKRHNREVQIPYNSVGPKRKISTKWNYICDVGQSELVLRLPGS